MIKERLDPESSFNSSVLKVAQSLVKRYARLNIGSLSVARRLTQCLFALNHAKLLHELRTCEIKLDSQKLERNIEANVLRVPPSLLLLNALKFFCIWPFSFIYLFINIRPGRKLESLSIIDSPIQSIATSDIFIRIFEEKIQSSYKLPDGKKIVRFNEASNTGNYVFAKYPIFESVKHAKLTSNSLKAFFVTQVETLIFVIRSIPSEPLVLLFYNDLLTYPFIRYLDADSQLAAIFKTNSEFQHQQFWLDSKDKKFNFAFIWYSMNTITMKSKGESHVDYFPYGLANIEDSLTWSTTHALWLEKFKHGTTILTSPLVFHKNGKFLKPQRKYIILFDVPPVKVSLLAKLYLFPEKNFYSESNARKFILDIVECLKKERSDLIIILKSKRVMHQYNQRDYFEFLSELETQGKISIVDPTISPEELIIDAEMVISMPFTSTNYISAYYNKPTLYYDPSGLLDSEGYFDPSLIGFAQSPDELANFIRQKLIL